MYYPRKFKNKDYIWLLKKKEEVNPNVFRYTFENKEGWIKVWKFYPDLTLAGKGFTLVRLSNNKTWYYTICTSMGHLLYPQYIHLHKALAKGETFDPEISTIHELSQGASDQVELIVKYYAHAKYGISWKLWEFKPDEKYFIKGSVGKGLNIDSSSIGNHVFFCGGTGVLPFLDTFAYILWSNVSKHFPQYTMFKDEKFSGTGSGFYMTIYAYFTKRTEAIGLEILESLQFLQEKLGKSVSNVSVNVIFTREGGKRLNKKEAMSALS